MEIETVLLVSVVAASVLAVAMLGMGVGAFFRRDCLRGTCGGPARRNAKGEAISCADCPNCTRRPAGRTGGAHAASKHLDFSVTHHDAAIGDGRCRE
jgi:hypothetical protein